MEIHQDKDQIAQRRGLLEPKPEEQLSDLGDRISIMGVELKKLAEGASVPALPYGISTRLGRAELTLLQKVAVSIELDEPLLLRGLRIRDYLPPLRILCESTGRKLMYVDAANSLSLRDLPKALVERKCLVAIDQIESLCMPAAQTYHHMVNQSLESKQLLGKVNHSSNEFRLIAGLTSPPPGAAPELRKLLSSFVYSVDIEPMRPQAVRSEDRLRTDFWRAIAEPLQSHQAEISQGLRIEQLQQWPEVDRKVRQFIEAVAAMITRGQLSGGRGCEICLTRHYPRVTRFIWRFYDGDLAATAQRALRHALYGYFDAPNERACLDELLRYVTPDSRTKEIRLTLASKEKEDA